MTETDTTPTENPTEAPETPPEPLQPDEVPDAPSPTEQPQEPTQEPAAPDTGEEAPGDGQQDDEQQEQQQSSEAQLRDLDRRATNLMKRGRGYAEAVVEYVVETEQPLLRCGFCLDELPGFLPSPAVQPFTPKQLSYARDVLGQPDEPPYVQATDARTCSDCDGWGQVLTGSKRNDQKLRKCFTCNGIGWEGRGSGDVQTAPNGHAHVAIVPPEQVPPDIQDHDPWGRPAGHPGYGLLPTPGMEARLLPPGMATVNPIG